MEGTLQQLDLMLEEDPGSNVFLNVDKETNEVKSIFWQTSAMREAFNTYPEVVEIDTTYNLATNRMPLIVYEVIDCFGKGRIAGYAHISSEHKEIVTEALQVLVNGCDCALQLTRVAMVDKDHSEISSIYDVLPDAEIHLCDYHVKLIFERTGPQKQSGYIKKVHPIMKDLIHAHTQEVYNESYERLKTVANDAFMKYFNQHWHEVPLIWSDYQRNMSQNLGERTTGRVESHNKDIKKIVDRRVTMPELIFRLRFLNNYKDMDNAYLIFLANCKTQYNKYSTDPVLQSIRKANTPYVGDLLQRQYERSREPPSANEHVTSEDSCDCKFFVNRKLPCAHIFRFRESEGKLFTTQVSMSAVIISQLLVMMLCFHSPSGLEVYDDALVPARWKSPGPVVKITDTNRNILIKQTSVKTRKTPLTTEEKYTSCLKVCTDISSRIANTGGVLFESYINALNTMHNLLKDGKKFSIVSLDDNYEVQGKN